MKKKRGCLLAVIGILFSLLILARALLFPPTDFAYVEAEPDEHTLFVELSTGTHVAYEETFPIAAPLPMPVIFVHGGPGQAEFMPRTITERFAAAGYRTISYHQLGAGLSSRADDPESEYTIARHVADLDALREELDAERMILIGQSWGGILIANYAAEHPERVEKLVLSAPGPAWLPEFGVESLRTTRVLSDDDLAELEALVKPHIPRLFLQRLLGRVDSRLGALVMNERDWDGFSQAQAQVMVRAYVCDPHLTKNLVYPGQGAYVNRYVFADLQSQKDPRPKMRKASAPVLILRPECDYVDPAIGDDYAAVFPNAKLVDVEDAGHEIKIERPDVFVETILHFLQENTDKKQEADPENQPSLGD